MCEMTTFPTTMIVRHRKENLKKCSLRGLEPREDLHFFTYPTESISLPRNAVMLSMEGDLLSEQDYNRPLLLLDGTWRYAERMEKNIPSLESVERRRLPEPFRTAYPRKQEDCSEPSRGLASVEALYLSYLLMGRCVEGLLDHYYWKDAFLEINNLDYARRSNSKL
jgi:pre-rRNA-processing protein TSR3